MIPASCSFLPGKLCVLGCNESSVPDLLLPRLNCLGRFCLCQPAADSLVRQGVKLPTKVIYVDMSGQTRRTLEQSVATPIEQQINGVDNMDYMYSLNATGNSQTTMIVPAFPSTSGTATGTGSGLNETAELRHPRPSHVTTSIVAP
jgi:hypothetical protein